MKLCLTSMLRTRRRMAPCAAAGLATMTADNRGRCWEACRCSRALSSVLHPTCAHKTQFEGSQNTGSPSEQGAQRSLVWAPSDLRPRDSPLTIQGSAPRGSGVAGHVWSRVERCRRVSQCRGDLHKPVLTAVVWNQGACQAQPGGHYEVTQAVPALFEMPTTLQMKMPGCDAWCSTLPQVREWLPAGVANSISRVATATGLPPTLPELQAGSRLHIVLHSQAGVLEIDRAGHTTLGAPRGSGGVPGGNGSSSR